MTRLLLVRHGQSTWNADGRWQGHADPPLSPLGERQSEAAVGAAAGVDAVWTSPLRRAARTAEIIGARLEVQVRPDDGLRERDVGEWTGLTRSEIESAWPGYLARRQRPPGFEPDDSVRDRGLAALDAIGASSGDATVLVVTHAGLIRVVERHLGGDAPPVPNLGGRAVLASDGAGGAGLVLGDPVLLVDPAEVEVTTPRQI